MSFPFMVVELVFLVDILWGVQLVGDHILLCHLLRPQTITAYLK